jgi:3-hydroxyisobutyrate dehydrogenase
MRRNRNPQETDVGFIGLGAMGAPMARRLQAAGYRLVVFDADPGALARFQETTLCEVPATLRELGEMASVVITMLPDGKIVRRVLLGDGKGGDSVAAGLAPGGLLIDMSSSSPVGTRELAAELAKLGHELIDAPVSGGTKGAVSGTLAIMAGGAPATVEHVRPLLETMGKVTHVGDVGAGHAMKALNNYLSAMNLAAGAEALIIGERFGLDPKTMVDVWNASTGRNTGTEHKLPAFILSGTFTSGFALPLMAKDLRLALDIAKATGSPSELLGPLSALYDAGERELGPKSDNTDIYKVLKARTGEAGAGEVDDQR